MEEKDVEVIENDAPAPAKEKPEKPARAKKEKAPAAEKGEKAAKAAPAPAPEPAPEQAPEKAPEAAAAPPEENGEKPAEAAKPAEKGPRRAEVGASADTLDIRVLKEMKLPDLMKIAKDFGVENAPGMRKQDLI
ncbi:MAG TPA: Rho termination factor N-terminal domain-containing protein, partial [Thermoanaerobaculia bacterium]